MCWHASHLRAFRVAERATAGGLASTARRPRVLLRDRPWLDVLLIYRNGRRAVLTMEKGIAGENVFNEAFKSWGAGS